MTLSLADKNLLRRLIVGELRSNGVTEYQLHRLYELCEQRLAFSGVQSFGVQYFAITKKGRRALSVEMQPISYPVIGY